MNAEYEKGGRPQSAIVAGHICIDITPVFPDGISKVSNLGELLKPGKLIQVGAPDVHTGGAVANTGLGMKRLGADVKLLGKIGDDAFGSMIRGVLDQYGAGDDLIVSEGETSSYSIVIAAPGIDRIFLHCPGANDTFDGTEIKEEALQEAALFHFGYPTLMRKMYEDDGRYLTNMFRRIREMGLGTSLDLAAVDPDSGAGGADWLQILQNVLPYVDFFVPSFEELCYMLDRTRYQNLLDRAGDHDITELLDVEEDIRPLAKMCLQMGTRAVLIKCGAPGMFLMTSDRMGEAGEKLGLDSAAWNHYMSFQKSFHVEKVLSGTGAGDISIAAFLTSILQGAGPAEAIENAAAAGALCCTTYDAISAIPSLDKLREMISNHSLHY